jgi:hypothetical protein
MKGFNLKTCQGLSGFEEEWAKPVKKKNKLFELNSLGSSTNLN